MNFASLMWYEKFNWDLYSCSGIADKRLPVYSINFRYSLGHRDYLLPTFWEDYHFIFVLNEIWYQWRLTLHESFAFSYLILAALLLLLLFAANWISRAFSIAFAAVFPKLNPIFKRFHCETAAWKLITAGILAVWYLAGFWLVPYWLPPPAGFFFFFAVVAELSGISIVALNRATTLLIGEKRSTTMQLEILVGATGVLASNHDDGDGDDA